MLSVDRPVKGEARLRRKNQLTLPEPIAAALRAQPDDLLIFETDASDPGTACVRVVPRTFAGSMTGVFGTTEDVLGYLSDEHAAWEPETGH